MSLSEKEWNWIANVLKEIEDLEEKAGKILTPKSKKKSTANKSTKKKKKSRKSKCGGGF